MILKRLRKEAAQQNWLGVAVDLFILILGVFLGIQVSNWNQDRLDARRGRAYLARILADLDTDLRVNANRERFLAQVGRYGQRGARTCG